ncbi:hypothetical protein OC861_005606 [Tilletia horrida]|nr:hypothetical protein OC861_005606 [Tilletia horrida]
MDVADDEASRDARLALLLQTEVQNLCRQVDVYVTQESATTIEGDIHLMCIQEAIQHLRNLTELHPPQEHDRMMRDLVSRRTQVELREAELTAPSTTSSRTWFRGNRGAWTLEINQDLLVELTELRFKDADICQFLNCSRATLKRRRQELGINKRIQTQLTHEDLCMLVRDIRRRGTGLEGERAIIGALRSLRVHVSRERLRPAVRDTDPLQHYLFRRQPILRRQYNVPFVNSLWHIDGHHKLIRWRIVIHGAIDGKSRVVTFLKASSNNLADTVGALFLQAADQYGWPSRVRGDHGGHGRGSFIQGSSVHNQRIERLWVDLQRWTTSKYKTLFEQMEAEEYFNPESAVDLWTLHFVFLPQLNQALQHFQRMWNNHPLRTPGLRNRSPNQIFTQGMLEAEKTGWSILHNDDRLQNFADYGVDPEASSIERERRSDDPHVTIPALVNEVPKVLLDKTVQSELRNRLDSIWPPPADMGIDVFKQALMLVKTLLQSPLLHSIPVQ